MADHLFYGWGRDISVRDIVQRGKNGRVQINCTRLKIGKSGLNCMGGKMERKWTENPDKCSRLQQIFCVWERDQQWLIMYTYKILGPGLYSTESSSATIDMCVTDKWWDRCRGTNVRCYKRFLHQNRGRKKELSICAERSLTQHTALSLLWTFSADPLFCSSNIWSGNVTDFLYTKVPSLTCKTQTPKTCR